MQPVIRVALVVLAVLAIVAWALWTVVVPRPRYVLTDKCAKAQLRYEAEPSRPRLDNVLELCSRER